jgi:hypothetical protein
MTPSDVAELMMILRTLDAEESWMSMSQVQDDDGVVEWQMEIDGRFFWAPTAVECFLKGVREYRFTEESEETLS